MTYRTQLILSSILFVFVSLQGSYAQHYETADMHLAIELKDFGTGPERVNKRVLFSYSPTRPTRLVGAAFYHENFRQIHTFYRNDQGVFVFPYNPPDDTAELVYRLVVDGIWMEDPHNPDRRILPDGISCSVFSLPYTKEKPQPAVTSADEGQVVFRYPSDSALSVTVAGSFNHWDPYMYNLNRDPGPQDLYTLSLHLPRGTYYYYFIVDGRRVVDPANPSIVRKNDGTLVSVLRIQG